LYNRISAVEQMKIKLQALFILILFNYGVQAQFTEWVWARQAGGSFDDRCNHSTIDVNQNVLITGYYQEQTLVIGNDTLHNFDPYSGIADILVAKYDSEGNVLWANTAGSNGGDAGYGVCTDSKGNVYVTGDFDGHTVRFGADTFVTFGVADIFIAKYTPNGNLIWVRQAGGAGEDVGWAIAVDSNSNIYIAGNYGGPTCSFGSITLTNSTGGWYIAKYDSSGNPLWARQNTGSSLVQAVGISNDVFGNIYATGYFQSTSLIFGTDTLINPSGDAGFIVKYDAAGNLKWAKGVGEAGYNDMEGISTDINGNVIVTGSFADSIAFGTDTLKFPYFENLFLVKYDSSGNVVWLWGAPEAWGENVSIDRTGNIYLSANFDGGPIIIGTDTVNVIYSGYNPLIAAFNPNGSVLWAINGVGSAINISVDPNGDAIYLGGIYGGPYIIFGIDTLTNAQGEDTNNIFTAKLKFNLITTAEKPLITGISVSVYPNPMYEEATWHSSQNLTDATLAIYNIVGQQIQQINDISGNSVTISRDNMCAGVYLYRLSEKNTVLASGKLVVIDN
jgi:hypothetical protein